MKIILRLSAILSIYLGALASAQSFGSSLSSASAFQHPRDQIALQLGAIQMGYTAPFQIAPGNATKAQQAANALLMGRNALDATVAKPAVKVQGFVNSPAVDTVEYRDQLYQAVEAVVTSPVAGTIRGSVSVVGSTKKASVSATLSLPPNAYTIPVPYALEAATSVDAQMLRQELLATGLIIPSSITVSTLAGSGSPGFADGIGETATFHHPVGGAVDKSGNIYVGEWYNQKIRKITPSGTVSTFAGSGQSGYADGSANTAKFYYPQSLAFDSVGNLYIADTENSRIRKITPTGTVSTFAGSGNAAFLDGIGVQASFSNPSGVAIDKEDNLYVADWGNHRIRKITPQGVVSTLAGSGNAGFADGIGTDASFAYPCQLTVDRNGIIYVTDYENCSIRKITPQGVVSTLAGSGNAGFADGIGTNASFNVVVGIANDFYGNIYVADVLNNRIRKITPSGIVSTLAGSGQSGKIDGPSLESSFYGPNGVAVDSAGNIYVSDSKNNCIRKITIK
jgi:sugar lactone lactonase YvrE